MYLQDRPLRQPLLFMWKLRLCVPNRGGIRPVTEMIQGYALAMTLEATEADLFATVFPHPTISEGMHEAALDAFGRALHV